MDDIENLFTETNLAALSTIKRDGRPQISNITYHYDADARQFAISITDGRAKTKNIRRDPRVSLYVNAEQGAAYGVAEGTARLSAVATEPDDDAVEQLIALYRKVQGEHPDWDDYRAAMVADKRLVLYVDVEKFYGWIMPGER
ncbi:MULTISPECIES: PPOX class F420-dependent oxidoreductase [Rhodococcus]|uniref:PPOX class F420-dependent enzyme n=1 Tax=Rhodococcoides kyotonense TaxID=398843 RepID=A0A177YAG2_9NOCA|nr:MULTISPECIES: PPOX class F420-dependent oxidoreductase [Rhodococcus]NIL74225.1 reductase [Rhodococcus sp. B10]OAK52516.1 PPOX class F420-dependent enzyme [Rhodococcus kyotonensis]